MPRGDGTGPTGQGPGTGRGMGQSSGQGRGGGNRPGSGPGGNCVCPACGTVVVHKVRTPCYEAACPKCGAKMRKQ